jgi:hypothetical protein
VEIARSNVSPATQQLWQLRDAGRHHPPGDFNRLAVLIDGLCNSGARQIVLRLSAEAFALSLCGPGPALDEAGATSPKTTRVPESTVLRCGQHGLSVLFVFDRFMRNLCNCVFEGTFLDVICLLFVFCLISVCCFFDLTASAM